jgi:hypothetical protein
VNSVGNLSFTFFSAKMPKRCMHVPDHRDFKISGKDSSPVRVFVTILVIKYIVLHHDILAGILLFLLNNLDYFLDSFVSSLELS